MERNYDVLLFDADGTLLDFDRSERAAMEELFARHGYPYDGSVLERYRAINSRLWSEYEKDLIPKPQIHKTRFQELFTVLGIEGDGPSFNEEYLDALSSHCFTMGGALEVCRALARLYRLYVVTNGVTRVQRRRLRESGLETCMSGVFVSEQMGVQKPKRAFFEQAAGQIEGFSASRTLIIGDSPTSDMAGGRGFGLDTCWFNPNGRPPLTPPPTFEIHSLRELPPLLAGNPA